MLLKVIHQLAAAAGSAYAFIIPENAQDGFYMAHIDINGDKLHEKIEARTPYIPEREITAEDLNQRDVNDRDISNGAQTSKRHTGFPVDWSQFSHMWCGCGFEVNHEDCDAATADLKKQVVGGVAIPGHYSCYSIRGAVVAFWCNPDDKAHTVYAQTITDWAQDITNACGWYVAGTYMDQLQTGMIFFGRMRMASGVNFCHDATNSLLTHC